MTETNAHFEHNWRLGRRARRFGATTATSALNAAWQMSVLSRATSRILVRARRAARRGVERLLVPRARPSATQGREDAHRDPAPRRRDRERARAPLLLPGAVVAGLEGRRPVVGVAHRGEAVRVVALRRGRQAAVVARDRLDAPRADRRRPHPRARSSSSTRPSTRSCGCCSRSASTKGCHATTTRSSPRSTAAWPGTAAGRPRPSRRPKRPPDVIPKLLPAACRSDPDDLLGHCGDPGADPGDRAAGRARSRPRVPRRPRDRAARPAPTSRRCSPTR